MRSAQARLDALNASIGSLISTLYRSEAGGSSLTLLSAKDPQTYLAQSNAVDSLTRQRADVLRRVQFARQEVATDQLAAKQKLALIVAAKKDADAAKADIDAKVSATTRLLASLKADERKRVLAAQAAAAAAAEARAEAAQRTTRSTTRTPRHTAAQDLGAALVGARVRPRRRCRRLRPPPGGQALRLRRHRPQLL